MIKIIVPGKPIAKRRPRFFRRGDHVGTYSDQKTEEGQFLIQAMAQLGYPTQVMFGPDVPLRLVVQFYFPYPSSMSRKKILSNPPHLKKPDLDNCIKFVKDVFNGAVWSDDRQVIAISSSKAYDAQARTEIYVSYPAWASPFNKEEMVQNGNHP